MEIRQIVVCWQEDTGKFSESMCLYVKYAWITRIIVFSMTYEMISLKESLLMFIVVWLAFWLDKAVMHNLLSILDHIPWNILLLLRTDMFWLEEDADI